MIAVFGAGGTLLKGVNHYLNSSQSNLLQQFVNSSNLNTNYLLQNLFKKKKSGKKHGKLVEIVLII